MMQEDERQEDETERRQRMRRRLLGALALVVLLAAVILVPPMISISHYKGRITQMVSQSLGRPVRLSSVELRLLPRPGFVITDLTVEEDPVYGAEPVLHANTVAASVGFFALWRGKLEISRISVDEASLNLVRTPDGRWNLDPIFRSATGHVDGSSLGARHPLPYLEATNSRVNIKNGLEKLPFSLMNADLSFWQADHDTWRLRLRGQPARTDVHLALADTGIVRLEATLRRAPQLRQMPIHVDMEWKEAQLGQLSRLLIGSDPGWRGDLTGQMQLDGTAGAAQVKTRLKATGVHRAEFAPAETLDFDANCSFILHYSARSIENLACDSPLGAGHVRLTGDLPSQGLVKLSVDVQHVPVSAGLATLRTLRNGIPDDLEASGSVSGQLTYDPGATRKAAEEASSAPSHTGHKTAVRARTTLPEPLQGNLMVDGFELRGGGLSQPIQVAKVLFAPASTEDGQPQALAATVALPAGGTAPLQFSVRLQSNGYQIGVRGPAAWPRLRELAHLASASSAASFDEITSDAAVVDLNAQGPWLPSPNVPVNSIERAGSSAESGLLFSSVHTDVLDGTITLHNASWKSENLANPVQIADATLHLSGGTLLWDPVDFTYGPVKGTASLQVAADCPIGEECQPHLELHFDRLDTATLQAALLGARKPGTVLSTLLARFTRRTSPAWPQFNGALSANTLMLGPVALQKASMGFSVLPSSAKFTSLDATLLGGQLHASGTLTNGDKPSYSFEGGFERVSAPGLCQVLKLHCSGGSIRGNGKLALAGFSGTDLAASAEGTLHFEWHQGAISGTAFVPKPLARFTRWTGDAKIGHEALTIKQNQVLHGGRTAQVDASVQLANPPKIVFPAPKPAETAHR